MQRLGGQGASLCNTHLAQAPRDALACTYHPPAPWFSAPRMRIAIDFLSFEFRLELELKYNLAAKSYNTQALAVGRSGKVSVVAQEFYT